MIIMITVMPTLLSHRNRLRVRGPVPPTSGAGTSPVEPVQRVRGEGTGRVKAPSHRGPRGAEPGGRDEEG